MICLTHLSNSIDWLHRHSNGRSGVERKPLFESDNSREGKLLKMIVSLLGFSVRDLWTESHHNKEEKWSRSLFYSPATRHDNSHARSLGQIRCHCWI